MIFEMGKGKNQPLVTPRYLAVKVALVFLVCLSRAAVFPASIWEQDEAYFAAAVVDINLTDSAPHPPFFPLWIGIGRALHLLGLEPAASLQVAGAALGSLVLLPMVALWSRFLSPGLALAASCLGLFAPGVWLLSGRAFTGTAATALVVAALACWARPDPSRAWVAAGSVAAGLAVLVRPHFGLVVAAAMVSLLAGPVRRWWLALVSPAIAVTAVGAALFAAAAGGPGAIREALTRHAALHFGALPTASSGLFDSGLVPALGHPVVAVGWCILTFWGAWLALRPKEERHVRLPVAAALAAASFLVFGLSNPAHPRYAVPLILLSCGFVVVGLRRLIGDRGALLTAAVAVVAGAAVVLPAAATYRSRPSPPLRAFDAAEAAAERRSGVMVVDRNLHAFVVYREAIGRSASPVVFDHVLELGASPPPASRAVMVFDEGNDQFLREGGNRQTFSCDRGVLRRMAQDRFLDVTVVDGAVIENRSGATGPFVILD